MFNYYGGFPPYVSVAKRRAQAVKKIAGLRKGGRTVSPVVIEGRTIATTSWGKAWCENLDRYGEYASRIGRGRTYVRNGSVIDLQLGSGKVEALVSGSEIYEVAITVAAPSPRHWKALVKECAGKIDSLVELLSGKLSKGVMEILCRKGTGLFPAPDELKLSCSCPDGSWMCKHLAAVLYGIGHRLDSQPALLFELRGVDQSELVGEAAGASVVGRGKKSANVLAADALGDIFGIELQEAPRQEKPAPRPRRKPKRAPAARRP